jgi:hypothetical protein
MRMGSGTVCTCGRSSKRSPPGGALSLADEVCELVLLRFLETRIIIVIDPCYPVPNALSK